MECPRCRLLNPDEALRCDCGYDFVAKAMMESYSDAERRRRPPPTPEFVRALGRRDVQFGIVCAVVGGAVAVASYAYALADRTGRSRYFLMFGLIAYGVARVARGIDRMRTGVERPFWSRRWL